MRLWQSEAFPTEVKANMSALVLVKSNLEFLVVITNLYKRQWHLVEFFFKLSSRHGNSKILVEVFRHQKYY